MRNLISYMFTSLDGYIADAGGGLEWAPIDDELMRFGNEYFGSIEGIVFGRNVYRGFVEFWDGLDATDPAVTPEEVRFAELFQGLSRIVVSQTMEPEDHPRAIVVGDDLARRITELKQQPGGDLLLICGPELRSTLAELGLIDRFQVLVAPVALGEGVPLFGKLAEPLRLRLEGSTTFGGGVVMLDYVPF